MWQPQVTHTPPGPLGAPSLATVQHHSALGKRLLAGKRGLKVAQSPPPPLALPCCMWLSGAAPRHMEAGAWEPEGSLSRSRRSNTPPLVQVWEGTHGFSSQYSPRVRFSDFPFGRTHIPWKQTNKSTSPQTRQGCFMPAFFGSPKVINVLCLVLPRGVGGQLKYIEHLRRTQPRFSAEPQPCTTDTQGRASGLWTARKCPRT